MQIGRVIGKATATIKHPTLARERMLIVQLLTSTGAADGEPVLAFDHLGAARGDRVILTTDGRAMQDLLGPKTPARYSVMGLPDAGQGVGS